MVCVRALVRVGSWWVVALARWCAYSERATTTEWGNIVATTENMGTELDRRLHAAFTENTGAHFLDSGGAYGRHWERNAGRTVQDFIDAPRATLDGTYGVALDAFHYLREWCELADDHAAAAALDRIAAENPSESWFGVAELLRDWAEEQDGSTTDGWNTYNWETLISQTLQGYCLTIPQDPRVILVVQIHGGCDVRGGYTRPYVFSIGDNFDTPEYVEGCFVGWMADADVYCRHDGCDWGYTMHGPDTITRDGDYVPDLLDGVDWDTLTCPNCNKPDALRADMLDASY